MKTKSILLVTGLLMMTSTMLAQSIDDYLEVAREVLATEKKVAVAENMELTEAESGPFWELYNEYNAELYKVYSDRVNIIKSFAKNYESMTDEKADDLWNASLDYQSKLLKLNKTYYKKFKKIMPAGRAALYFQIENKIAALVNAELALDIPLLETR